MILNFVVVARAVTGLLSFLRAIKPTYSKAEFDQKLSEGIFMYRRMSGKSGIYDHDVSSIEQAALPY